MPHAKRAYVPKIRGCYECSQRRIDCDNGFPSCAKCIEKNIDCSGYGRYRFVTFGKTISKTHSRRFSSRYKPFRCDTKINNAPINLQHKEVRFDLPLANGDNVDIPSSAEFLDGSDTEAHLVYPAPQNSILPLDQDSQLLRVLPTTIESCDQRLLLFFSERIAPILVVIDDQKNRWRCLVLPIALECKLVRDAVISTSAYGFAAHVNDQFFQPDIAYQKVIHRLRQLQDLAAQDTFSNQCIVLTLLLLIIGVLFNASSDFRIMFRSLDAFLKATKSRDIFTDDELGRFLYEQVQKFRGYGAPYMSREEGMAILSQTHPTLRSSSRGWDEFFFYWKSYPNLSQSLSTLYELNRQACIVYLTRILTGPDGPTLSHLVDSWKEMVKELPLDFPGTQLLIWPAFIMSFESSTQDQQYFFKEYLMQHHRRNGLINIKKAIDCLKLKWEGRAYHDWTHDLTCFEVFVI